MPYKDIENRRAYGRQWMKRNPEKAREAMRRWRRNHPDEHNAETRAYYSRHKERVRARNRAYQVANREAYRVFKNNYRTRRNTAGGSFTLAEWLELVARYEQRCAYCGEVRRLVVEHRVPLCRGGTNFISNIVPRLRSVQRQEAHAHRRGVPRSPLRRSRRSR